MKKRFSLLIFFAFATSAMLSTQFVPFLTEMGYSPMQRGSILSSYAILGMLSQMLFGYLSDKSGSIKRPMYFSMVSASLLALATFHVEKPFYLYHFVMLTLTAGMLSAMGNLMETWIMEVEETREVFSAIRSFGSLGWALSSLISGQLAHYRGFRFLSYAAFFMSLLFLFLAKNAPDAEKVEVQSLQLSDLKILFQNKAYVLLIFIYLGTYIIYSSDAVLGVDYLFYLGGNSRHVGIKWGVQAISEIPLLFFGARLLKRFDAKSLLFLALLILMGRFLFMSQVRSVMGVIMLSLTQALSFPLILITQRKFFFEQTPLALRSSGQMIAFALTSGLAAILSPILSSVLMTFFSIEMVLVIAGLFLLIPMILLAVYAKKH